MASCVNGVKFQEIHFDKRTTNNNFLKPTNYLYCYKIDKPTYNNRQQKTDHKHRESPCKF